MPMARKPKASHGPRFACPAVAFVAPGRRGGVEFMVGFRALISCPESRSNTGKTNPACHRAG